MLTSSLAQWDDFSPVIRSFTAGVIRQALLTAMVPGESIKSTSVYGVTVSGTVGMNAATYSRGFAYDTEKNVTVYESVSGLPIAGSDESVLAFDVGVASSLSVFYQVIPGKLLTKSSTLEALSAQVLGQF